jgi:heme-binding protein
MSRRLKQAAVVLVAAFAAAQLLRPERANPPIDASRAIQADVETSGGLVPVLDRACNDCHSNATVWPWYTHIAPVSWVIAHGVTEGRKAVNFSEWAAYHPDQQRALLALACQDASDGRMPGRPWTVLHPDARLSKEDINTICAAARQAEADAAARLR